MEKKLPFIAVCCLFLLAYLTGCQKQELALDEKEQDTTRYAVSFEVAAFSQQEVPIGKMNLAAAKNTSKSAQASSDAIKTYLKVLNYFLYNSKGKLVTSREQRNVPNAPYGSLPVKLTKGDYKLIVIGTVDGMEFTGTDSYSTAYLEAGYRPKDIFYKETAFTVDGSIDVQKTILLERIVGHLEVRQHERVTYLWDGRPEIRCRTVSRYPFDPNSEYIYPFDRPILPQIKGQLIVVGQIIEFVSSGFILPDRSGNFDSQASYLIPGVRGNVIDYGGFDPAVIIKPNKKVILTGSVTGANGDKRFDILADTTWSDTEVGEFWR